MCIRDRDTIELQRLRQRSSGISHLTLASGKKVSKIEEELSSSQTDDPFKLKTGGLLDLQRARQARALENGEKADDGVDRPRGDLSEVVGTQFSKETRVR